MMSWRVVQQDGLLEAAERHLKGIASAMSWNDTEALDPSEVLDAVQQERALFLEAVIEGEPVGGAVVQFVNAETLHVWLAWRTAPGGNIRDWWRLLCGEARRRNFKVVSAMSCRPLGRLLEGMSPRATVYEAAL